MEEILTSIALGLLATLNPCVLPLYPGFLAYLSSGQEGLEGKPGRYFLGFFVLAGVLTMMLVLGAIMALLALSTGEALSMVIPVVDLILIILGILLLLNINPFKKIPQIQVPVLSHPFASAFIYGLLYGPIVMPCTGPMVVTIFLFALRSSGQAWDQLIFFLLFGIGFGIPLLVLSLLSGAAQRWITRQLAVHSRLINLLSGLLLIGIGVFDLIVNRALIGTNF